MQELSPSKSYFFRLIAYDDDMQKSERPPLAQHLASLRQAAGLSQAQLAQRLGVHPSNIGFWELSGTPPRGEVLPALARALGVTIDELLGVKSLKRIAAKGHLQQVFEEASRLPRRQQQKLAEFVKLFVAQHGNGHKQAA